MTTASPNTKTDSVHTIKEIVNSIITDSSSPIASWLVNVVETYLSNTQSIEPLTTDKLFQLTNDMLLTYSITSTQTESEQICAKLMALLQDNQHIAVFNERFPVHCKCVALYTEDNQWYDATVINIIEAGELYLVAFDGYENQQNVNMDQIQSASSKNDESSNTKTISLKDAIKTTISQKEKDVEKMIMCDVLNNGVKGKKYHNDLMELHPVEDEKFNLALNNAEEQLFAAFFDGNEEEKDDDNELDENDIEKYTVGEGRDKRRINPLNDVCCVCARISPLTWHHLIPKCTHNEYLKAHPNSTRLMLNKHGIWICRQCHSAIHGTYSNKELMKSYWKINMLLESEKIQKWIKYVRKRKVSHHYDRRANKKNIVAQMIDKKDTSTKIKYIQ